MDRSVYLSVFEWIKSSFFPSSLYKIAKQKRKNEMRKKNRNRNRNTQLVYDDEWLQSMNDWLTGWEWVSV